jgi:eukaryotic-like serine/threonine-protein kinase
VLANTTGLCTAPNVKGKTLPAARKAIARANCGVGKIRRAYSKNVKKGRVISEKPRPGTTLPTGGKVDLVLSRGRKTLTA